MGGGGDKPVFPPGLFQGGGEGEGKGDDPHVGGAAFGVLGGLSDVLAQDQFIFYLIIEFIVMEAFLGAFAIGGMGGVGDSDLVYGGGVEGVVFFSGGGAG